jgi:hypothetical protein
MKRIFPKALQGNSFLGSTPHHQEIEREAKFEFGIPDKTTARRYGP